MISISLRARSSNSSNVIYDDITQIIEAVFVDHGVDCSDMATYFNQSFRLIFSPEESGSCKVGICNSRLDPSLDRAALHDILMGKLIAYQFPGEEISVSVVFLDGDDDYLLERMDCVGDTCFHIHGGGSRHVMYTQGDGSFFCGSCDYSCVC